MPLHATYHMPPDPIKLVMSTQGYLNCLRFSHLFPPVLILAPRLASTVQLCTRPTFLTLAEPRFRFSLL